MLSKHTEQLDSKVLGKLMLMQSFVLNLPNEDSIFSFVCKGLLDVPGIEKAEYESNQEKISTNESNKIYLPIQVDDSFYGNIHLTLSDNDKFQLYQDFLSNFMFMIGVILQQKQQKKLIEKHKIQLELRVKERTAQLNKETQLLKSIIDTIPVMVTIYDREVNSVLLNNAVENITGWTNEDAQHANIMELAYPDPKYREQVSEIMKAHNPDFRDIIMRTKDGRDIETTWANVEIPDGRSVGVVVDISERKELESELINVKEKTEENRRLLKTIINATPDLIWLKDTNGIYLNCNKRFEDFFGKSESEIIGKTDYDFLEKELADFFRHHDKLAMNAGNPTINEEEITFAIDGHSEILETIKTPLINNKNDIIGVLGVGRDITGRKKVENALKDQNQYLEKLNNSLGSVVFTVDIENRKIEYVNNRVKAVFGYNPDECIGNSTSFLYPNKEAFQNYGKQMQKAIKNNQEFLRIENTLKRKNGQLFNTDITTSFLSKTKVVAVISDITDRKKAEQQLIKAKEKAEESEKQLRLISDNFVNGMIYQVAMLDENRRQFNYISSNVKELYGCTVEEAKEDANLIYGKLHPADVERLIAKEKEALKNMSVFEAEARAITPNGNIRWAYYISKPRIINGVACWDGIEIDITERKQMELELLKAKERAEESEILKNKLVANIGDVIVIIDHEGNNRYKSPNVEKLFGWKPEDLIGNNAFDKVHPDDIEEARIFIDSLLNEPNKTGSTEVRYRHKNGNYVWIKFTGSNLMQDPIISGILGNYHDISESKNAETELLKAKEKAEESDRLKSAFLANMSHEIRTPMNGILGFTNLLQEHDLTGEQQQQYIEIIKKSGDRMLSTVNDIIEISKIDSGQMKVSKTKLNISKHLLTLHNFFTLEAEKKGLKLVIDNKLSEDESSILTDKNKLDSILTNLIKNALKFTEKGSIKIGVSTSSTTKNKTATEPVEVEFYIKDTGVGIPSARKDAVFNRFEQADIEDKKALEGSGLGLAITKSYVEMLGGKIWVESEEKKGSTFFFTISYNPIKSETKNVRVIQNRITDNVKNLNVLIVEDDDISSLFLSTLLKGFTKNIQIVKNGLEAVEICRNDATFDLILMDVKLPGLDGLEATKRIREFNENVKIVAQTAYALEGDRENAIKAGCNDYISKPINKKKLITLINKYI